MRSKPFLKRRVRRVLNLFLILCLIYGCSTSTTPTYLKENISDAIQNICKNEHKIDVKVKLVGQTLWIYFPVEDIFIKADKPDKYTEKFSIQYTQGEFKEDTLQFHYLIKAVPEKEKRQQYKYNKTVLEKINNVCAAVRRVIFSAGHSEGEVPKFFSLVIADIKNGFQVQELFYLLDLKKVSYQFISWNEYQHRAIQETQIAPEIIGDKEGRYIDYKDLTLKDFITRQIAHRIRLKFQKPEVDRNADIDKEILKIITYTIKTYNFKDFGSVELDNLLTNNKVVLDKEALLARPIE